MKLLSYFSAGMTFAEAVTRFNSNISYSGLLHAVTQDVSHLYGYSYRLTVYHCISLLITAKVLGVADNTDMDSSMVK